MYLFINFLKSSRPPGLGDPRPHSRVDLALTVGGEVGAWGSEVEGQRAGEGEGERRLAWVGAPLPLRPRLAI